MPYEAVIGLEIHVELKTRTKMFCSCKNDADEKHPNVNVCPICLGHPGTLPAMNREAVRIVQRVGATLNCELAEFSKFDRKNYFYPDLPKGYQISQYDMPLCVGGYLEIATRNNTEKNTEQHRRIRITRIHLEEDAGRLLHAAPSALAEGSFAPDASVGGSGRQVSLVDFNRAGLPLMELVTEPDIRSAEEARAVAEELRLILRYLGASDANMEKGQLRIEVNISLMRTNVGTNSTNDIRAIRDQIRDHSRVLGTKVEIKNLNSLKSVAKAVEYETQRQSEILASGQKVTQETRGWHDTKQITFSQRSKEEAHDYRYFPEPDLPPMRFSQADFDGIRASIPELPQARRSRFMKEFGLGMKEVEMLVAEKKLGEYFEQIMSELGAWCETDECPSDIKKPQAITTAANWLLSDFWGLFQERAGIFGELAITPENFAEFIKLVIQGKVSSKAAKEILTAMYETGQDPSDIVEERGLTQVSDTGFIEEAVKKVIEENPKAVEDYKSGKQNAIQFLAGKVMAATRGKANPSAVREALQRYLT